MTELLAVYDYSNQLKLRFDYLGGGLPVGVNVWDGSEFDYYYLAYDQVGSLRYVFDETGSLAKAVTYDAFGNVLSDSNPSLKLPLGFAGGHTDHDTGLVRFVARDYDPEIGRWTAGDPIGIQGGLNAYLYVGNNPVNLTDPYGLAPGLLDRIHDGLGLLGMVPVIGIVGDIGAFGVSVIQLDVTGALIDAGSMLPLAGGAVRGGQLAYKAGKAVLKNAPIKQTTILGENMMERVIPFAKATDSRTLPFGTTQKQWDQLTPQQRWKLNDGALRTRINEGDNFRYIGIDSGRDVASRSKFDLTGSELLRLNERGIAFETVSPQEVLSTIGRQ